ncbi:MAG: ATP-binding protein [Planctomycetia bacterium]|uniref:ATP-binding protein n=1 Tax=Candidatus Kuenenia sp. TaxID=2499824 RepID=UPI001DEDC120|nr:ATP-binding protein [Planctomycetia bacterium]GJQ48416.1 MAG: ATP-binding protein [Candidatus Kuenenia stuttgartiensis]
MPTTVMSFESSEPIGRVMSVDTMRVFIHVDDHELLKKVMVGNLIAVQGATGHQFLISIVERVTRLPSDSLGVSEATDDETVPQPEEIQDTIRAVLVGTYRSKDGDAGPSFKRGADSCPQIDQPCHLIQGVNLTAFMGVLSQDVPSEKALRLGHFAIDPTAQAVADGDRFFQRHAAILGSTGSGKSYTVASLLERANTLSHPNIILLDMHGEYASLAKGKDYPNGYAQYFKIAGPGDLVKPKPHSLFLPYWLLNREEMLSMLLDRSDDNAPNQAMRFTSLVLEKKREALERSKLDEVLASFTVDSPIHYDLEALVKSLREDDQAMVVGSSGRDKQGQWHGKLTRFISRLEAKIKDRRYGFLFQSPKATSAYDWLQEIAVRFLSTTKDEQSGIKVVDFSEVPADVLPTIISVFARVLYDVQFWMRSESRTPVCLVCDEAHLYLPVRSDADAVSRRALDTFERIAKEGRKYGFALLVVSQRPSDVSKTILSQCNNFIALRLTNEQDQSAVKSVMPDSMAGIADILPLLDIGEAIVLGDSILLPSRIKLDKPTATPLSLTKNFWREWTEKRSDSDAIRAAVENLRRQSKGTELKK